MFSKSYTFSTKEYAGDPGYWDARQVNDVRQSAITQGHRPTGDVKIVSKTEDGVSTVVTFEVETEEAQGAESDQDYAVTHAKVSPGDQATFEAALDAGVDPDKVDARVARENLSPEQAASDESDGKATADEPVPGLSPQKVEPSTDAANDVESAEKPKTSRRKAKQVDDAPGETSGERQGEE